MKNFKTFMMMSAVMASLTVAFGTIMYCVFTASVKAYGIQPGDIGTLIVAMAIFIACGVATSCLLGKAIDWVIWCQKFRREFGFEAPSDPHNATCADHQAVEATLNSIRRFNSVQKWVEVALLAEKFGFHVQWPVEIQAEYARTHR